MSHDPRHLAGVFYWTEPETRPQTPRMRFIVATMERTANPNLRGHE
jgi:hypothetical protein